MKPEMRIGIIGSGAAGLCTAWLLREQHQVTLIEKSDRLGGHANTIEVDHLGEQVFIDAGAEFFSKKAFPHFCRLQDILEVPRREFSMTANVYSADHQMATLMPPMKDGKIVWSMLGPTQLSNLLQFRQLLQRAKPLMDTADTVTTVGEFLRSQRLSRHFREHFIRPFLQSGWCLEWEDFEQFIAYDVLQFAYKHQPAGMQSVKWQEVAGGLRNYIKALTKQLSGVYIEKGSGAAGITRENGMYTVRLHSGKTLEFDQLVIATNAKDACRLLQGLPQAQPARTILSGIDYFKTVIAVHADARLMPADKKIWSVVNMRYNQQYAHTTIWKPWKSKQPIFRSWVTYEQEMPDKLYAIAEYDHPMTNRRYFAAQENLAAEQGKEGLWFAGMHTHDVETHESAIISAIKVAKQLHPSGSRLQKLTQQHHEYAR